MTETLARLGTESLTQSQHHGSKNHGSKNHGSKNHGSKNHGSKNHGSKIPWAARIPDR
ncbi:pentapeptide repeat-containing protein [Prochlorothrix hollandica]|uniref:pentapeptide repeat-containing protein n=1 Tax=Prochlorothrix hollandica TaxID=1223 RepID=UPI001CEC1F00